MKRFGLLAAAALSLAGFASQAQASLVIDSFSNGALTLINDTNPVPTPTTLNNMQTGLSGVVGGRRSVDLTVTTNGQPGITRAIDTVNTSTQRFAISNDEGVDSTTVLTYNGASNTGLGGINLTSFGDGIAFNVLTIDTSVSIKIDLTDTDNVTSTKTLSGLGANSVAQFAFNSFSGTANFSSINKIVVTFNTPQAADLSGSFLRVTNSVPEPSTVAALASGALFMGGVAFRRRRAAKA